MVPPALVEAILRSKGNHAAVRIALAVAISAERCTHYPLSMRELAKRAGLSAAPAAHSGVRDALALGWIVRTPDRNSFRYDIGPSFAHSLIASTAPSRKT